VIIGPLPPPPGPTTTTNKNELNYLTKNGSRLRMGMVVILAVDIGGAHPRPALPHAVVSQERLAEVEPISGAYADNMAPELAAEPDLDSVWAFWP
jgi:hypothetical protein